MLIKFQEFPHQLNRDWYGKSWQLLMSTDFIRYHYSWNMTKKKICYKSNVHISKKDNLSFNIILRFVNIAEYWKSHANER